MTMPLTAAEIAGAGDRIGTDLVFDMPTMRVWHLRLASGETLPAHRHDHPYFWTVLTDGSARSRQDDGRIVEVTYTAGQTRYFPDLSTSTAFVHDLTNTGEDDLVFVTVEFRNSSSSVSQSRNG